MEMIVSDEEMEQLLSDVLEIHGYDFSDY